jgi:K+-sensing histidine kinase KdpD
VEDTGAGIAEEDMSKLFNSFSKLHRTAEMNTQGIGLGLTIVKQIVEAGGGNIVAESAGVDKGSFFIMNMHMTEVKEEENNLIPVQNN